MCTHTIQSDGNHPSLCPCKNMDQKYPKDFKKDIPTPAVCKLLIPLPFLHIIFSLHPQMIHILSFSLKPNTPYSCLHILPRIPDIFRHTPVPDAFYGREF